MYKIIKAEKLNEIVYLMVVEAPMVAKHCQPGQFIIVKEDDAGERIPLTICDLVCSRWSWYCAGLPTGKMAA